MLPLTLSKAGESVQVQRVGGSAAVRKHLEELGFAADALVQVVQNHDGDLIVKVRDTSLAITKEMAARIQVTPK